jgi:hypothetical protein
MHRTLLKAAQKLARKAHSIRALSAGQALASATCEKGCMRGRKKEKKSVCIEKARHK